MVRHLVITPIAHPMVHATMELALTLGLSLNPNPYALA